MDGTQPSLAHRGGGDADSEEVYENVESFQNKRTGVVLGDHFGPMDIMAAQRADELNGNMPYKHGQMHRTKSVESDSEEEVVTDRDGAPGKVAEIVSKLVQEQRTGKVIHGMPGIYANKGDHPTTAFDKAGTQAGTLDKPPFRYTPMIPRPTQLATGAGHDDSDDGDDETEGGVYEVQERYGRQRRDKDLGEEATEWHDNEFYEGRV